MKERIKRILLPLSPLLDLILVVLGFPSALLLRLVRGYGLQHLPLTRRALARASLLPVRHHYYEPVVHPADLSRPLDSVRALPGIDLRVAAQLALLASLDYRKELEKIPLEHHPACGRFYYDNPAFGPGDAELLYALIRQRQPRRLIEVGSGYSTAIARLAIAANEADQPARHCEHTCIEPYHHPWLDQSGATIVRDRVESRGFDQFTSLEGGDILFIDSSHVIRPQGDVLFEYLELLPQLRPGVLVHIHDIFTPRDYPREWVLDEQRLWNEQYLLEALLCANSGFRIVISANHLWHEHREALQRACPALAQRPMRQPASFWIERR